MDLRQSAEYGEYMKRRGWTVEGVKTSTGQALAFIRQMPVVPVRVMKVQRFEGVPDWQDLQRIKEKHRVILTVLEPEAKADEFKADEYRAAGYKLDKGPFVPAKTIRVETTRTEKELWEELSKDARQRIKKAEGVKTVSFRDREGWRQFWLEWKKWKKGYLPSFKDFNSLMEAHRARGEARGAVDNEGRISGGIVVLWTDDRAFYYFGWTGAEGRAKDVQYKLVWEAIKGAKKKGLKWFDLEGIYDERFPRKEWRGFSAFKEKFGGERAELAGCYSRWL